MTGEEIRLARQRIKDVGKEQARKEGIVLELPKKKIGRPRKHEQTQTKTFRLPTDLLEQIEKDRQEHETLTDSIIRLVKLGLLL